METESQCAKLKGNNTSSAERCPTRKNTSPDEPTESPRAFAKSARVHGSGTGAQAGACTGDCTSGILTVLRGESSLIIKYCSVYSTQSYWLANITSDVASNVRKGSSKTEPGGGHLG